MEVDDEGDDQSESSGELRLSRRDGTKRSVDGFLFENYASDPDIQALLKGEPFTERPVPPPVQPPADPPEEVWGES